MVHSLTLTLYSWLFSVPGHYLPSSVLLLSLLLDSSMEFGDCKSTLDGIFDSPAKVLEKGFNTVRHLFTTQTINYTEEAEVPQNLSL